MRLMRIPNGVTRIYSCVFIPIHNLTIINNRYIVNEKTVLVDDAPVVSSIRYPSLSGLGIDNEESDKVYDFIDECLKQLEVISKSSPMLALQYEHGTLPIEDATNMLIGIPNIGAKEQKQLVVALTLLYGQPNAIQWFGGIND
jgi:hypothetical protein